MITLDKIAAAQSAADKARANSDAALDAKDAALDTMHSAIRSAGGSLFNRPDGFDQAPERVAYVDAATAYDKARGAYITADRYARMLENVFKVQVRQIVGAALATCPEKWEGMPAHYKKTLSIIETIANDALRAAGVEGVKAYARFYGTPWSESYQADADIYFMCDATPWGVNFRKSECQTVSMRIKGGQLSNENFVHWYTTHGNADALQITAADVKRAARRLFVDLARMEEAAEKYNATANQIAARYQHMGVGDTLDRIRLFRR